VLHQIGAGALGPVFRAYEPDRDRLVAIKLFKLDLPPEQVHHLVTELERLIAAGLTHPGIAAPLAAGLDANNVPYLVEEFAAADSLDVVVRDYGPAPPAEAVRLAVQLAGALDFASVVNVDHGALHPRDVLISADDMRITGFGVARALERVGVTAPVRRPYTAPERAAGASWDRHADIFSLAALVHETLWGRRIAGTGQQAADALTAIPGADLPALRAAFGRGLAERPGDRFDTALEFAGALKAAFPAVNIQSPVRPPTDDAQFTTLDPRLSTLDSPTLDSPTLDSPTLDSPTLDSPTLDSPTLDPRLSTLDSPAFDPRRSTLDPPALDSRTLDSRMWPLALALIVGVALGFGGGYAVGRRDRGVTTAAPVATASVPPPQASPAGREFTETAVAEPPKPAAGPAPGVRPTPDTAGDTTADAPAGGAMKTGRAAVTDDVGRVVVRSTPAGARVFIDGRDQGRTPTTIRNLRRGTHRVRLVREGYATEERRIVITPANPAQSVTVALARTRAVEPPARRAAEPPARTPAPNPPSGASFLGSLSVESRPAGAKVFIDGKLSGATPLTLPKIGAGEHAIRIEHDGYQRWSSSVRIVAGERNRVTASLEK
jgi:serine/threonine protein kinase